MYDTLIEVDGAPGLFRNERTGSVFRPDATKMDAVPGSPGVFVNRETKEWFRVIFSKMNAAEQKKKVFDPERFRGHRHGDFYKKLCAHGLFACKECNPVGSRESVPDWFERGALDALMVALSVPANKRKMAEEALADYVQARVHREQSAQCLAAYAEEYRRYEEGEDEDT